MKCVVLQPSYIPWRGYFHQIQKADAFVFYDDVKYDKDGWRNRNRIKSSNGPLWLTVPVLTKGTESNRTPISQIEINWSRDWARKHWATIKQHYAKAPHFQRYAPALEELYGRRWPLLADLTIDLTVTIAGMLRIESTTFVRSSCLEVSGTKTNRLLNVLRKVGATHYVSGPSARGYLEEDKLRAHGITVEYMTYDYPEYGQLYPPYDPKVSVLDLLFMTGHEAPRHIWG
jgi:hypothetical protein